MPVARGTHAEWLAPGLNMHTFNRYREKPEMYRLINNVLSTDRAYVDDYAHAGFGALAPKEELGSTIMDEPLKLGGVRIIMKAFALGFVISEEMREDDQYGLMSELAGDLGKSSRYTAELWGHDVWNNAFVDTKYVGRDGQALISAAHPVPGIGGTISNRSATDIDLSQVGLEAGWANFQLQVDDRGIPIDSAPSILLIHPTNVLFARRLLESAGFPGGNLNDINPLQGMVQIVSTPYLADEDNWFLLAPVSELDVRFYWRKRPDTKTWDDDDVDGTIHKIKQRHGVGFGDWRGVYGSAGGTPPA